MSIRVTCPECDASFRVPDDSADKVPCPECGARVRVSASEAAGFTAEPGKPATKSPRRWDDEPRDDRLERRPRKKAGKNNTTTILVIVGGVLALGCLVCAGVGGLGYMALNATRRAAAEAQARRVAIQNVQNANFPPPNFGKPGLPPGPPAMGRVLLAQQGRLAPNDPVRDGRPHKAFQVKFEQGKTYVIDLRSTEMDSFLNLYNPAGLLVASDDDGGGFPNARIRFMVNQPGTYTIGATVFGGVPIGGANFNLTVQEQ